MALAMILTLSACGSTTGNTDTATQESQQTTTVPEASESTNSTEVADSETSTTGESTSGSNVLVAVFSRTGENYQIGVIEKGNTMIVAEMVQEGTGADLFEIKPETPYPNDYDEMLDIATEEQSTDARPAMLDAIDSIEQYGTIFVGYLNWWYSTPMAILSFIDEYDLEGKKIILFCSHGTGGLAGSVEAITNELPESCTVSDNVLSVYRSEVMDSKDEVLAWLQQIGAE